MQKWGGEAVITRRRGAAEGVAACCSHSHLCKMPHMATNLAIDDRLLTEAQKIGGHRTKKATVTQALEEFIQRRKQVKILELFDTLEFDPKYDYKKQRRKA